MCEWEAKKKNYSKLIKIYQEIGMQIEIWINNMYIAVSFAHSRWDAYKLETWINGEKLTNIE